jgi:hypothetical protein
LQKLQRLAVTALFQKMPEPWWYARMIFPPQVQGHGSFAQGCQMTGGIPVAPFVVRDDREAVFQKVSKLLQVVECCHVQANSILLIVFSCKWEGMEGKKQDADPS